MEIKKSMGQLEAMCHPKEIREREKEKLLHVLECTNETQRTKNPKADFNRVVKQYVRSTFSISKQQPLTHLRTSKALIKTTNYLIKDVCNNQSEQWNVVYDFVNDRLRAVRQDMIMQEIEGAEKITILEQCVLFHLYASYRLTEAPVRVFDPHLNSKALMECLDSLLLEYDLGISSKRHKREFFESIYFLLNLDKKNSFWRYHLIGDNLRHTDLVIKCRNIHKAYLIGNVCAILNTSLQLPPGLKICLFTHWPNLCCKYLNLINFAYSAKGAQFPIEKLADLLLPFVENKKSRKDVIEQICTELNFTFQKDHILIDKTKVDQINLKKIKSKKWEIGYKRYEETKNFEFWLTE